MTVYSFASWLVTSNSQTSISMRQANLIDENGSTDVVELGN